MKLTLKQNQLISINGMPYIYQGVVTGICSGQTLYQVSRVNIDEFGRVALTNEVKYVRENELANKEAYFTRQQWRGMIKSLLIQNRKNISRQEAENISMKIVDDFLIKGVPPIHKIEERVAEYV